MSEDALPRWRACPPSDIVWRGWDDDFVAFHRPSGATHFLNSSSKLLLEDILAEPRTAQDVATQLAGPDADSEHGPDIDEIRALLARFEALGLIERA